MTEYRIADVGVLPPYDRTEPCPKCDFAALTTEYYAAFHNKAGRQCSLPGAPLMALGEAFRFGDYKPAEIEYTMPEHFERQCPNCGYRFAEAVHASPPTR